MASEIEKIKNMDEEAVLNYLRQILELETVVAELNSKIEKNKHRIDTDYNFIKNLRIGDSDGVGPMECNDSRCLYSILEKCRNSLASIYMNAVNDYRSQEALLKNFPKYLFDKFKDFDNTAEDDPCHFDVGYVWSQMYDIDIGEDDGYEEERWNEAHFPVRTDKVYKLKPNGGLYVNFRGLCKEGYVLKCENDEIQNTINTIVEQYLNPLYEKNIIHPKYRNLVAIASFVDYFETGRVDKFKGSDGAYNLFEQEIRANIIISELKQINESLEVIKKNQYALYNELKEAKEITKQIQEQQKTIVREIETCRYQYDEYIKKTTGIIAKNSEITARCSKAIKYLTILNTVL